MYAQAKRLHHQIYREIYLRSYLFQVLDWLIFMLFINFAVIFQWWYWYNALIIYWSLHLVSEEAFIYRLPKLLTNLLCAFQAKTFRQGSYSILEIDLSLSSQRGRSKAGSGKGGKKGRLNPNREEVVARDKREPLNSSIAWHMRSP